MSTMILNVSNRLPVTVGREEIKKSSGGLVAALEGVSAEQYSLKWIGWPGGDIDPSRHREIERTLERDFGSTPVFIDADEARGHYEGYSNSTIWPILHYLPSKLRYEPQWWEQYRRVNRHFTDKVASLAREGDIVWVHDYQLMLLPAMLREAMPSLKIGFFLHTPFPSYELFRCIPHRDELVAGLLGADLVGFHTFGYMRHFRSSVLRLLGIESEVTRIRHDGRTMTIGVYPIGINARKFDEELARPDHKQQVAQFHETFGEKRIVLSVERLDYTKGILHRLDAIDMFLANYRDRDRIKFIFVSVPSRENVAEYQALREEVEARVGRINGRYTTLTSSPIHFMHGSVNFSELTALYALADVGLVTPLIDGMNLVAKEYVAAQAGEDPGVLVLSEFAGAAQELLGALVVNPYDAKAVAETITTALDMPIEKRRDAMRAMRDRVRSFDAQAWAQAFINDLAAIKAPQNRKTDVREAGERLGAALRASTKRIALFLDYDGTLREIERDPAAAAPHLAVRSLLGRFAERRNVDVTIISGRTPRDLEAMLGAYPFGLVAEHGASVRRANSKEWVDLDHNVSYRWKPEIMKVLRLYEASTPGSFVEDKRTSLVWHYRRADAEFGSWKAKQLVEELGALTASEPIQVRHGQKIVEIVATQVNKAAAILHLLEDKEYDLIVAAGDDATDESMFRLDLRNLITIKVGEGETRGRYRLPSPESLRRLLNESLGA
jgi:trehalose 6-phosphate synthase/phosphatase